MTPGLENTIVDRDAYQRNVEHLHARDVTLPKIAELADPAAHIAQKKDSIGFAGPDAADASNLFRVHWHNDRERVFNLGYYTWVEQQGTTQEDFDRRRDQAFWGGLLNLVPVWDGMIERFNKA